MGQITVSSEQPRKLEFTWEGALAELKDQYTSVELQHEAMQWRFEEPSAEAQKGGTELFMQDKQTEIEKEEIYELRSWIYNPLILFNWRFVSLKFNVL